MPAAVRSVACVWAAFAALAVLLSHVAESAAAPPPREMVVPPTRVVGGSSTGMLAAAIYRYTGTAQGELYQRIYHEK